MIEYILFDLSEVWIQGMIGVEKEIAKHNNINLSEDRIREDLEGDKLTKLFEGKITEEEYWKQVTDESYYGVPPEYFPIVMRSNFTELEGTREIIEQLKEHYTLGLLSDHVREWVAGKDGVEARYPIRELFTHVNWSFDIEHTKRDKASFDYAIGRSKVSPQNILFIDDNRKNLVVAKAAGIGHTYHFTDAPSFKSALPDLGVLVKTG